MFLRHRNNQEDYEPLSPPTETFVHLFYCSERKTTSYELSLRDLVHEICQGNRSAITAFETQHREAYILLASSSSILTTNSVEDGITILRGHIDQGELHTFFLCNAWQEKSKKLQREAKSSTLVVIAKCDDRTVHRLGLLPTHINAISTARCTSKKTTPPPSGYGQVKAMYYASAAIAIISFMLLLTVILSTSLKRTDILHSWLQYETRGSIGPRFQLPVDASNATSWNSYAGDPSSWTLRIDDQAVIPIQLLDDEERHYQEWIQKRYPEMDQIRLNGLYLNGTWLNSPAINQVPTDELFHFAHCVLAVKRYIKARDTGRHVCGRDIDREHVQHCLDALDWWAFPEGRRGEDLPNSNRTFWWRTKVCFD
jgi:hypothetical protein